MKKRCSTCGLEFDLDNFYKCGKTSLGKTRYAFECKKCRQKREKQRYYEIRQDIMEYRKPCVHCGNNKPYLIEFHHRNPDEKEFVVAHWRNKAKQTYLAEIAKCDPLCRNCHEEYHYLNRTLGISYEDYLKNY